MRGAIAQANRGTWLAPLPRLLGDCKLRVFELQTGRSVLSKQLGPGINTRGVFASRDSDRFLIAKRDGTVDVYRLSPDASEITKEWTF